LPHLSKQKLKARKNYGDNIIKNKQIHSMENSTSKSQILVVGATGFLGLEICKQLTSTGKNVTGLVRKSSATEKVNALKQWGVRLVEGDLKDSASIRNALAGITTVITTVSSTFSRQDGDSIQTVDYEGQYNLCEAAIAAGVKQYIYISFMEIPHQFLLQEAKRRVEKKLVASAMTYTILRPSFFMEAWLSPAIGFDFPNAKATIYGEGKNKISWIAIQGMWQHLLQLLWTIQPQRIKFWILAGLMHLAP
jgi:uncharacterized protein YbjT (DUF2867 family)